MLIICNTYAQICNSKDTWINMPKYAWNHDMHYKKIVCKYAESMHKYAIPIWISKIFTNMHTIRMKHATNMQAYALSARPEKRCLLWKYAKDMQ